MRRNQILWVLYDFGNSIVTIVFAIFYTQWMVYDQDVSDIWFNMLFVLSTALLLIIVPVLAAVADHKNLSLFFLRCSTLLQFTAYIAACAFVLSGTKSPVLAAALFLATNFFYQSSLVFYNALFEGIAENGKEGALSGAGQAGNWVGQLAGLLFAFPILAGKISFFGLSARAETFLPATLLSFIFVLPLLIFFTAPLMEKREMREPGTLKKHILTLFKIPGVALFLCGYFLFNDAVLTAGNNFPLYLQEVFHTPDTMKSIVTMAILLTSAVGAYGAGKIADRIGHRKAMLLCLYGWIVILPLFSAITNLTVFIALTTVMGLFYGAMWSVTRAALLMLLPKGHVGVGMSFYTIAERFSSFLGPILWSGMLFIGHDMGALRYRLAILSMTVFIALGVILTRKLPKELFERKA